MEPIEATRYAIWLYKISKYLIKIPAKFKKFRGRLTGIWCVCWQHDSSKPKEFEIGSMVLYQFKSKITGEIYHGDNLWPFKGTFKDGRLTCTYPHKEEIGNFELRLTDEGRNWDRLKGTWSGLSDVDGKLKKEHGLLFFAARHSFYNRRCTLKVFLNGNEGKCLQA